MDYTRRTQKVTDVYTGEIKYQNVDKEYTNHKLKGLSMGRINIEAYDFLQELFNYRKSSILVINYIRDNLDNENKLHINNITKTVKSIGVDKNVFYITLKKLKKVGLMYELENKIYSINPYIFMSTQVKKNEDKVLLQAKWAQMFGDFNTNKRTKITVLSEVIFNNDEYSEYLKSNEWKEKANECKKLANNKCVRCGSENELSAHHISYKNLYNENQTDLKCLCHLCHILEHM